MIMQNGESSRDFLLSVTNRKALAPGGHSPQSPPPPSFKTLITLLPVTFSQHDPQLGLLVVELNLVMELGIVQTVKLTVIFAVVLF